MIVAVYELYYGWFYEVKRKQTFAAVGHHSLLLAKPKIEAYPRPETAIVTFW